MFLKAHPLPAANAPCTTPRRAVAASVHPPQACRRRCGSRRRQRRHLEALRALPPSAGGSSGGSSSGDGGGGGSSSEFEGVQGGDAQLQEALLRQLRVQVEAETLKEEIKEDLKGKVEELKAIGEDLISKLDAELGIEKFRAELESTQVLSDANDKFNELEEQLQQIKDQIQADQADLARFEAESAAARSQGLFFKNLYQPDAPEGEQQGGSSTSSSSSSSTSAGSSGSADAGGMLLDPAAARKAAAVVASTAEEEVASPFRMYLFGAMAAVLAVVVAQDLSTPDPSLPLDALYLVLGLLLGVNAFNERTALAQVMQQRQQQYQQHDQHQDPGAQ